MSECRHCGERIIPCKAKPGHGAPGRVKCKGWRHSDTWHLCATDEGTPVTTAEPPEVDAPAPSPDREDSR